VEYPGDDVLMKIAFVDNLPVGGGISRFSLLLCKSLVGNFPGINIDYFIHYENLKQIPEITSLGDRVNVRVLRASRPVSLAVRIIRKAVSKAGFKYTGDPILKEIEELVNEEFSLAYFPSAHMMKKPRLKIPVVGTIHDFNWKYFFGRQIFPLSFVEMMDEEILKWMNQGLTVCSSMDVVNEAVKLYPGSKKVPAVVPIAPVVVNTEISKERAEAILRELNIDFPYLIFPGNFYPHKNHLNLFTAFSILKQRPGFENYKLLLTGMNSEQVSKGIAGPRGVQLQTKNSPALQYDVMGMGYRDNETIDALIRNARLLVSPSLYEAICTPGMDAWNFGIPTAISDIPPFREHEATWGIRSAFFNPMDPVNMADVMEAYLNNYDQARKDGESSKINMSAYTWNEVTKGYMDIFSRAIKEFI
jgi:glycosyltransferase involved in cell wall biosynthesis